MKLNGNLQFLALGAELQNAIIERLASDPATTEIGRIYYNTTSNEYRYYDGTSWAQFGDATLASNINAALGAITDANGDYDPAAVNAALGNVGAGTTDLLDALQDLDAAIAAGAETYRIKDQDGDTIVRTETTPGADNDTIEFVHGADVTVSSSANQIQIKGAERATGANGIDNVILEGGAGGATAGDGGGVLIRGGYGYSPADAGGDVQIFGGQPNGTGAGGNIFVSAYDGGTSGGNLRMYAGDGDTPGFVTIEAGQSSSGGAAEGGAVNIRGGRGDGDSGGNVNLSAGDTDADGSSGGGIVISSGGNLAGVTDGDGGEMNLSTGDGKGSGQGGSFNVYAGSGGTNGGSGGYVGLYAGQGYNGGPAYFYAGNANQAGGYGGQLSLYAGQGAAANASGGTVSIYAGNGQGTGEAGGVVIGGGSGVDGLDAGGSVQLEGGDTTGTMDAGNINLIPGTATGDGDSGTVRVVGTGAGLGARVRLYEGNNPIVDSYIELKAPDATADDTTYTLPVAPAASGYILASTTGGVMSWIDPAGTGATLALGGLTNVTDNTTTETDEFILSDGAGGWVSSTIAPSDNGLFIYNSGWTQIDMNFNTMFAEVDTTTVALASGDMLIWDGVGTWQNKTPSDVRTNLGLVIGTDVQAWDAQLDDIAALDVTQNDNFIVSDGVNWTQETPAQVRTTLGLGTMALETASDYLLLAGGTMNSAANVVFAGGGEVTGLPAVPTGATAATSKAYVDALVSSNVVWLDPIAQPDLVAIVNDEPATPIISGMYIAYNGTYPQTWTGGVTVNEYDMVHWRSDGAGGFQWDVDGNIDGVETRLGVAFNVSGLDTDEGAKDEGFPSGMVKDDLTVYQGGVGADPTLISNWDFPHGRAGTVSFSLVSTTSGTKTFVVSGNVLNSFKVNNAITITGSTGGTNDGTYTIQSVTFNSPNTDIVVAETVPSNDGATGSALPEFRDGQTVLTFNDASSHSGESYSYSDSQNKWVIISGPGNISAGVGLSLTGQVLNVNLGAGIIETPSDQVGIDLRDSANSALILTTDGTSREGNNASARLWLLLDGAGGLTQSSSGLAIDTGAVTNTMLANDGITFAGDSGSSEVVLGGTATIAGGTGITTAEAAGTVTINVDSTQKILRMEDGDGDTFITVDTTPTDSDEITIQSGNDGNINILSGQPGVGMGGQIFITGGDGQASYSGGPININAGSATSGGSGGWIDLIAGDGAGSYDGGDVTITAGTGENGGDVNITAGDSSGAVAGGQVVIKAGGGNIFGYSGNASLQGGDGVQSNAHGGDAILRGGAPEGGAGVGGGFGAVLEVRGGKGDDDGGPIVLSGGNARSASTGDAGTITLRAGDVTGTGSAGQVSIEGGDSTNAAADGAPVVIRGGNNTGGGTAGNIVMQPGSGTTDGVVAITGPDGTTAPELRIVQDSNPANNYIGFTVADDSVTSSITYQLPEAPASNGQVLASTTGGVMSWVDVSTRLEDLGDVTADTSGGGEDPAGSILVKSAAGATNYAADLIQFNYDSTLNGGAATSHTVTHNLGQRYVNVTVYDSTHQQILPQSVTLTDANTVTVTFNTAIQCYIVVMGVPGVGLA